MPALLTLNGDEFTIGRAKFFDQSSATEEPTPKVYVRIIPGQLEAPVFAQLDTGAAWSVLDCEVAEEMGLLEGGGVATKLRTKDGLKEGYLVRMPVTLVADDGQGDSVEIPEAIFFVSAEWPKGKNFIGYTGFIEVIRIALDAQQNYFYFGPSA